MNHRDEKIKETRAKAIREFRKLPSYRAEDQDKEEQRWRRAEIIIVVCDMLLTGFDAPIVQTMYLDKGLKNHALLQANARVNRPYNELKKEGVIRDFWGRQPRLRRERLDRIRASGRSQEKAIALAVGAEAWSSGAQLIFVTEPAPE